MPSVNFIDHTYSGDLSEFYLARRNNEGRLNTQSRSDEAVDDVIVIGNPAAAYVYDWLGYFYLPGIQWEFGFGPPIGTTEYLQQKIVAKSTLQSQINQIFTNMQNINDGQPFRLQMTDPQGQIININTTFDIIKKLFLSFKYNVVENMILAPGYGGFTTCENGNCFSNVDSKTLLGYQDEWGQDGISYYIFHELAHNIADVKSYEIEKGRTYIDSEHPTYDVGYGSSAQFSAIEAATNTVARQIAEMVNMRVPLDPPHGFLY